MGNITIDESRIAANQEQPSGSAAASLIMVKHAVQEGGRAILNRSPAAAAEGIIIDYCAVFKGRVGVV